MRIVSLIPSATEILFAVGAGDDVVGVTFECDHPPAARERRVVSTSAMPEGLAPREIDDFVAAAMTAGEDLYRLDAGALAEIDADLVVTQDLCAVCAVDVTTVDETGSGARERRVGVHCPDRNAVWQVPSVDRPLRQRSCAVEVEAARGRHDYLGCALPDLLPGDAERLLARRTQRVLASGSSHHLGHPVPRRERWVGPLQHQRAGAAASAHMPLDGIQAVA